MAFLFSTNSTAVVIPQKAPVPSLATQDAVMRTIAILYLFLAVISAMQLFRTSVAIKKQKGTSYRAVLAHRRDSAVSCCSWKFHPLMKQHLLLMVVCLLRAISGGYLGNLYTFSGLGFRTLLIIPYPLIFYIFTTLVYNWSHIIHLPFVDLESSSEKKKIKRYLFQCKCFNVDFGYYLCHCKLV